MIREDVEKKYKDVQGVLENALENTNSIEIQGQKENAELMEIRSVLESLNVDFKQEIDKLEHSSEWDKFCIAFFGETNAGKSTIIESLRIIYDEETRRASALAQQKGYHNLLKRHCNDYSGIIASLQEVNAALKTAHGKKNNWISYLLVGAVGLVIGLLLA